MNRSIHRLYLTMVAGIVLLVLMLGWWQVVSADDLADNVNNRQTGHIERLVDRGRIISADGQVLAESRARVVAGERLYSRRYPRGSLAAQVVGYASAGGQTGIERFYNRYLTGSFGSEPLLQRLGRRVKKGADVRLSLDTRIQEVAEQALERRRGAVVAVDPATGQILAMASSPTFSLQQAITDFGQIEPEGSPLIDRATAGRYPPGSTFKVVTASAALEEGLYTPESRFTDTGSYATPGGPIRNFGQETFGIHSLSRALTKSINTTFAAIGDALGRSGLGSAMDRFGFGRRPVIDLPDSEVLISGRRRDGKILPNDQEGEDTARIAIGQEQLAVTPLQMAMVAAAVANGGLVMSPHLMASITDRAGSQVTVAKPHEEGQAMSAASAEQMTAMMENVVSEGTGTAAALSSAGVSVAGKTGTAESGAAGVNDAWFIGFAPSQAPKVAVAVVIEDTNLTGGAAAAPIAASVMREAIQTR